MATMTPVKFFCEFCGSQVRAAERICPHCGSFFSQVRCPACGFQGENKLFLKGCPVCGFATATTGGTAAQAKPAKPKATAIAGKTSRREPLGIPQPKSQPSGMPVWVFPVLVAVFLAVIALAIIVLPGRP